jgi:hypothetical protein
MLVTAASVHAIVVVAICGVLLPPGWWAAVRCWRGKVNYSRRNPWPRRRQEANFRAGPAAVVSCTFGEAAALIGVVWGVHASVAKVAFLFTVSGGLAAFLLAVAAYYASRPRWAIPPPLRDRRVERPG